MRRLTVGFVGALVFSAALLLATAPVSSCGEAPTNLSASVNGLDVTYSWTGVSCARAYALHRDDITQGAWASTSATSVTFSNVHHGSRFVITVRAIGPETTVHEGPPSAPVTVVVP